MWKLNSIICASVPLLGPGQRTNELWPSTVSLVFIFLWQLGDSGSVLYQEPGRARSPDRGCPGPGGWLCPRAARVRADLTEPGPWAFRRGLGVLRQALGPSEAQTFPQSQLPEVDVEGHGQAQGRSPRQEVTRGAKVAPGSGGTQKQGTFCVERAPRPGRLLALCRGRPSSALWLTGWGVGEQRGCFKKLLGVLQRGHPTLSSWTEAPSLNWKGLE